MKPVSVQSRQFLQKMQQKYSVQALPIRANEHFVTYNRFSQGEAVLEEQITKSDVFDRDQRVTREIQNTGCVISPYE